jgi:hypothetical protein
MQEAEDALKLQQADTGPSGPAVRLSAVRLVLTAIVGATSCATLTVRAVGTAGFQYHWTRSVPRPALATIAAGRTGISTAISIVHETPVEQSGFYMCHASGEFMPGEDRTFEFMWKPTQQGMATELWQLHTSPPCVPGFEPPQVRIP